MGPDAAAAMVALWTEDQQWSFSDDHDAQIFERGFDRRRLGYRHIVCTLLGQTAVPFSRRRSSPRRPPAAQSSLKFTPTGARPARRRAPILDRADCGREIQGSEDIPRRFRCAETRGQAVRRADQSTLIVYKGAAEQGRSVGDTKELDRGFARQEPLNSSQVTALALAFAAGMLSILSPCVLPLVPIVLGAAVTAHPFGAVALAAGLALSFTGLGLLLALVGFGLGIDAGMFRFAAAAIMIVLGAVLLVPSWQARLAAQEVHSRAGPIGVSAASQRRALPASLESAFCSERCGRPASARRWAPHRFWPRRVTTCWVALTMRYSGSARVAAGAARPVVAGDLDARP